LSAADIKKPPEEWCHTRWLPQISGTSERRAAHCHGGQNTRAGKRAGLDGQTKPGKRP